MAAPSLASQCADTNLCSSFVPTGGLTQRPLTYPPLNTTGAAGLAWPAGAAANQAGGQAINLEAWQAAQVAAQAAALRPDSLGTLGGGMAGLGTLTGLGGLPGLQTVPGSSGLPNLTGPLSDPSILAQTVMQLSQPQQLGGVPGAAGAGGDQSLNGMSLVSQIQLLQTLGSLVQANAVTLMRNQPPNSQVLQMLQQGDQAGLAAAAGGAAVSGAAVSAPLALSLPANASAASVNLSVPMTNASMPLLAVSGPLSISDLLANASPAASAPAASAPAATIAGLPGMGGAPALGLGNIAGLSGATAPGVGGGLPTWMLSGNAGGVPGGAVSPAVSGAGLAGTAGLTGLEPLARLGSGTSWLSGPLQPGGSNTLTLQALLGGPTGAAAMSPGTLQPGAGAADAAAAGVVAQQPGSAGADAAANSKRLMDAIMGYEAAGNGAKPPGAASPLAAAGEVKQEHEQAAPGAEGIVQLPMAPELTGIKPDDAAAAGKGETEALLALGQLGAHAAAAAGQKQQLLLQLQLQQLKQQQEQLAAEQQGQQGLVGEMQHGQQEQAVGVPELAAQGAGEGNVAAGAVEGGEAAAAAPNAAADTGLDAAGLSEDQQKHYQAILKQAVESQPQSTTQVL